MKELLTNRRLILFATLAIALVAVFTHPGALFAMPFLGFSGIIIDLQAIYSDSQVVAATGNSTNVIDSGGNHNFGNGEPLKLLLRLLDGSTAAPTFTVNLVGADDVAFGVNKVTIGTVTPTLVTGGQQIAHIGIPAGATLNKRFTRVEYVVTGGTAPSVTVLATIVKDEQTSAMV